MLLFGAFAAVVGRDWGWGGVGFGGGWGGIFLLLETIFGFFAAEANFWLVLHSGWKQLVSCVQSPELGFQVCSAGKLQ